jgi:hypothetical protein
VRTLYSEIREQLEDETSAVHVRLWNNQIRLSEEGQQIPFEFPAIFIDFPFISWKQLGKGTQITDEGFIVRLYICFSSFHTSENEEDLEVFTLRNEVYLAMQDFQPTGAGKLERVSEQTDVNHTNMYMWVMDFKTSYQDITAQYPRNTVEGTITTLEITEDLQIDEDTVDGIRTDFEFPE